MIRLLARFALGMLAASGATWALLHAVQIEHPMAWALGVSLLLAIALAWPLMRRVRALERAATRMADGDFRGRYEADPGEALENVGSSLNHLADRVDQLLSDQRDLMRTVAHEVRAPIARMRFRIEMLQSSANGDDARHAGGLVGDLAQIDSLFEELLTYVGFDEFDQERPALQPTRFAAAEVAREVVEQVAELHPDKRLSVTGDETAVVVANRKLFERAVSNLVRNAAAYGESEVVVEVRASKRACVVDVQDDGPGIPEADRPRVRKPFMRLDASNQKVRGHGLGLAIVGRIMRLHGGALHIVGAPRGGTSCQLVWPTGEGAANEPREERQRGDAKAARQPS